MSLLATFSDLIKGCPKNIKRRLLRDILLILFVTSGAIVSIVLVQGVKTQRDISTSIIVKANKQVSRYFLSFTDPLKNTLKLLGKWGESGLLQLDNPPLIATQFQALIEIQPNIFSISLADTKNNAIRLSHQGDQWILDQFTGNGLLSFLWDKGTLTPRRTPDASYDMSKTAWFRGAMITPANSPFFLTRPYTQKGTGERVITTSLHWNRGSDPVRSYVSAVSFPLTRLMDFIKQLEITPNSHILLFEKDGTLLSSRISNRHPSEKQLSKRFLEKISARLKTGKLTNNQTVSLKDRGKTWWLGIGTLYDSNDDVWVSVIIPEDDIFADLHQQWLRFGLLAGSIFFTGIIMTIFLVRRYSHQLKDLPQQHIHDQNIESEIRSLIRAGESTTLEFKSTMRTNLKTGKPGKEIEIAWLKTVAAFMNSDGGILLIGVDDSGRITGTAADNFASEDKCRLHFKNMLNSHIGAEFTRFIHLKIVCIDEHTVLIVECERVRRPVFLSMGKQEDFYIRSGPSSMKLSMSQMVKYLAER